MFNADRLSSEVGSELDQLFSQTGEASGVQPGFQPVSPRRLTLAEAGRRAARPASLGALTVAVIAGVAVGAVGPRLIAGREISAPRKSSPVASSPAPARLQAMLDVARPVALAATEPAARTHGAEPLRIAMQPAAASAPARAALVRPAALGPARAPTIAARPPARAAAEAAAQDPVEPVQAPGPELCDDGPEGLADRCADPELRVARQDFRAALREARAAGVAPEDLAEQRQAWRRERQEAAEMSEAAMVEAFRAQSGELREMSEEAWRARERRAMDRAERDRARYGW